MDSFKWSLKPIIIFIKLLGIHLDVSNRASMFSRILGSITLMSIVAVQIYWLQSEFENFIDGASLFLPYYATSSKQELFYVTFGFCDSILKLLFVTGPFLVLLRSSLCNTWANVWVNLINIQTSLEMSESFYRAVRRICWTGVALVFAVLCKYYTLISSL